MNLSLADKLYFKIGEVSEMTGLESYILRYWETEFPMLKPCKNKSGQRVYTKEDIELVNKIKNLLYDDKYTIEGARQYFADRKKNSSNKIPSKIDNEKELRNCLVEVKKEFQELLDGLEKFDFFK
ncbi:MerR family transcriptional regulator [bacterium]|nr:MerR family transcriptional regulator [bacterium]